MRDKATKKRGSLDRSASTRCRGSPAVLRPATPAPSTRSPTVAARTRTGCRSQNATGTGPDLPRLLCRVALLLSHVCTAEALSQLRHQMTDTANASQTAGSFHWGSQSLWTSCSNTCGYGVQYTDRGCLNTRNESVDAKFCPGSTRMFKVCKTDNTQCPNYYVEYFSRQCYQHGKHPWQARPSAGGCQFTCYGRLQPSPGQQVPMVTGQWMPDGTLCTRYRGCDFRNGVGLSNGVCFQGQCLDVGCDGLINSTKLLDSCGVCGGDGSSCRVISAEFSELLPFGYSEVVELPIGALNIRVYETSENFLAIMDATGQMVFNSGYRIQKPGRYVLNGHAVNYKRCGGSQLRLGGFEELTIAEPISEKIIILIVSTRMDSKAYAAYQYSLPLPPEISSTTMPPLSTTPKTAGSEPNSSADGRDPAPEAERRNQDLQNVIGAQTDTDGESVTASVTASVSGLASHLVTAVGVDPDEAKDWSPNHNAGSSDSFLVQRAEASAESPSTAKGTGGVGSPDRSLENLLPDGLRENPHLGSESAGKMDADSDSAGSQAEVMHPGSSLWGAPDPDHQQGDLFSGDDEDADAEPTANPSVAYSVTDSVGNWSQNDSQALPDQQPDQHPEDKTNPTTTGHNSSTSPTSKPALHPENDLLPASEEVTPTHQTEETTPENGGGGVGDIAQTTEAPLATASMTAAEDIDDLPGVFFGYAGSEERLFEDIPEIMEKVNPSIASQEVDVAPSAKAATGVVISRGDVPRDELPVEPHYEWATTGMAPCSTTCTRGISRSYAYCTNHGKQVEDSKCDQATKPEVVERGCEGKPCKPRWAVGSWSACTVTCGTGCNYRTVHCWLMIAPGLDTSISNTYCNQSTSPDGVRPCTLADCGPQWQTSDWSECSEECGEGVQTREVRCSGEDGACNPANRPTTSKRCRNQPCPSQWTTTQWDTCRIHCSVQFRRVNCVNRAGVIVRENACPGNDKPLTNRLCGKGCTARWVPQSYGPCQGECGSTLRRRKVVCAATSALSGNMQTLADSVCSASQKPPMESPCQLVSCQRQANRRRRQMPQWLTSPWSVCSVTCGTGQRTRAITCNRKRNQPTLNCNENKKPDNSEACHMGECPAANPSCSDSPTADCNVIRRANLCRYASYKRSCCASCSL